MANLETGHTFKVIYDKDQVISKTVDIKDFVVENYKEFWLTIEATRQPNIEMSVTFADYWGKQFVIEAPVGKAKGLSQNSVGGVKGLKVNKSTGDFKIRKATDADFSNGKAEESRPARPSLNELSPEELKDLLRDILGRL